MTLSEELYKLDESIYKIKENALFCDSIQKRAEFLQLAKWLEELKEYKEKENANR